MRRALLAFLVPVAALAGGCGEQQDTSDPPAQPRTTARIEDFPPAKGKTLADLRDGVPEGPVLTPAVSVLEPGVNRIAFGLFDRARKQLSGASVAVYVGRPDGTRAKGPFLARSESLEVKPQFRSKQTAQDPDAARGVYVADVKLGKGKWIMTALVRLDGRVLSTQQMSIEAGGTTGRTVPDVGEPAPRISTPTVDDVGGEVEQIDTRIPPLPALHRADLAEVLGNKPVVLVFATPQLCQSRICGPVVDVAAQVREELDGRVEVIHQEIYKDNRIDQGFRKQVGAYGLPTEPWTFVIDRRGIVSERFEGAFSVAELTAAAKAVAGR